MHDELQLLVDSGYSPYPARSAATRDASRVVAKMVERDEFGTIEIGKRADLVLLKHNPPLNVQNLAAPLGVMTAGVWLPRDTLDVMLNIKRKFITSILREIELKTGTADSVITRYRDLCELNRNSDYNMPQAALATTGYDFLFLGKPDDAIKIFSLNVEQYPYAANSYDCLAEAYLREGDKDMAIEIYRKALAMDPNFDNARKALQELGVESP